ncbi:Tkp3 protein [Vanderwaltozyma polyspora DSM 70294]|uniref:Tkp3 protein n=1 Tax=Vanderwaltozyma polyspora (strain ATCC 22028 / DSM 70294 / BCRC 21397 / CBS 2163 / NBRC 10782 / NRRL Y-8283 / UCD 57-17) TaxID=436907 RepID=A7TLG9_VANPO|nr:Tkp3 protein [Vanderwaltozyma polyspora DSM 70294]EDO16855.1 Tkp3 protein [Vanderwaltozyma polyspora DSM 70294]
MGKTERATHPRLTKYLDLLNTYRLNWKYIKGTDNHAADYLSRYGLDSQPTLNLDEWDKFSVDIELNATTHSDQHSEDFTTLTQQTTPEPIQEATEESHEQANYLIDQQTHEDIPNIIHDVRNLSWSQILDIYQNIIHIFTWVNNNFYIIYLDQLHHILTDVDYIERATSLHNAFHANHQILEKYDDPGGILESSTCHTTFRCNQKLPTL